MTDDPERLARAAGWTESPLAIHAACLLFSQEFENSVLSGKNFP